MSIIVIITIIIIRDSVREGPAFTLLLTGHMRSIMIFHTIMFIYDVRNLI